MSETSAPTVEEGKKKIEAYFTLMTKIGCSDLHIKTGRPAALRVDSQLRMVDEPALSPEIVQAIVDSLLSDEHQKEFHDNGNVDLAWQIPDGDRFRINIFRQRTTISIAARRVTKDIPDFAKLNLPPQIGDLLQSHQGLILLAGPTGSGKSTTIASMLDSINQTRRCHIITLEDPIEYLYEDKKAFVNQREIGIDVPDFATALRAMLREDPDIVLLGELRDHETFEAALQAAETGHLVFGTIHASTAPQTVSRILELFPSERRPQILQSLAFNLQAVICQRLLPCVKEGVSRVPTIEIMRMTPMVRELLEKGREADLGDVIRGSERDGMLSFTSSLLDLINRDMIEPKVAYNVAPNVEELKMRMKGISTSSGGGLIGR